MCRVALSAVLRRIIFWPEGAGKYKRFFKATLIVLDLKSKVHVFFQTFVVNGFAD
jgi:hypothetical protein